MTATMTDTAAIYLGGPLAGQQVAKTRGARRLSNYRHDDGRPMAVRSGDREFIWRPLSGRPTRRGYILTCSSGPPDAYIHASIWPIWQAADGDVRRLAVQHYERALPGPVAPQQRDGGTDALADGDAVRTGPRPGWDLCS